jgi:hypothetical protein
MGGREEKPVPRLSALKDGEVRRWSAVNAEVENSLFSCDIDRDDFHRNRVMTTILTLCAYFAPLVHRAVVEPLFW